MVSSMTGLLGRWRFIDSAVLNLIERSCRGFQRLTGRTNVWLAVQLTNLSIIIYFVWAGLWSLIVDVELRVVAAIFCVVLTYALTQTMFKTPIETYEMAAYQRVARGLRNPRRLRDAPSAHVVPDALSVPRGSSAVRLREPAHPPGAPYLRAHPADDDRLVSAGVRSVATMRRQSARVDARALAVTCDRSGIRLLIATLDRVRRRCGRARAEL
jgi:hypothetical protein